MNAIHSSHRHETHFHNRLKMGVLEGLRATLEAYPDAKWGFVIYRCTYADDAEWDRFISYLNIRTRLRLEEDGIGDLFSRIDWNVQHDPSLEGASMGKVRQ